MFTDEQKVELADDLDGSVVKTRSQSGRTLSYIEGWWAISEANRIFGFDGWTRETVDLRCVAEKERAMKSGDGFGVTYIAKVRVTVGDVVREGCGTGHGIDRDLGQAHESALKEAETDAMKRALMTFGNPFGLALYDKEQVHVSCPERSENPRQHLEQRPVSPPKDELLSSQTAGIMIKAIDISNDWRELNEWPTLESTKAGLRNLIPADYERVKEARAKKLQELRQPKEKAA